MALWNAMCVLCALYAVTLCAIASTHQDYQTGVLALAALLAAFGTTKEEK